MGTAFLDEVYKSSFDLRQQFALDQWNKYKLDSEYLTYVLVMTPREAFVPVFFQLDEQNLPISTPWIKFDASHPNYLPQIYQDQPLITHLDAYGRPDCSSSMPAVMFQMLEALESNCNHTVLEIGTGTGYNAAVIEYFSKTCMTIDREPVYVKHLSQIVQDFQLNRITPAVADGVRGYPPNAPYDRIIVTASTPIIPPAWIDQLKGGGRLVCELAGPLAHAILVLHKAHHNTVQGTFLPTIRKLMPMKSETLPDIQDVHLSRIAPTQEIQHSNDLISLAQDLQDSLSFRWFLQWHKPHIRLIRIHSSRKEELRLIAPDKHSYIAFSRTLSSQNITSWQAMLHTRHKTRPSFWDEVLQSYQIWRELGQPEIEQYTLSTDHEQLVLRIHGMATPM